MDKSGESEPCSSGRSNGLICGVCSKAFKYKSYLKRHELTHAEKRPFACDICGQAFTQQEHVDRHIRTQHKRKAIEEQTHKCELCPETRKQAYKLALHMEVAHSESSEKDYRCKQCCCTFSSQPMLYKHSKLWHTAKEAKKKRTSRRSSSNVCIYCCKAFSSLSNLKHHVRGVHEREARFKCQECDQVFFQRTRLDRHTQRAHQQQPFACVHCSCSYALLNGLRRHEVTAHQGLARAKFPKTVTPTVPPERLGELRKIALEQISATQRMPEQGPSMAYLRSMVLEELESSNVRSTICGERGLATEDVSLSDSADVSVSDSADSDSSDDDMKQSTSQDSHQESLADMRRKVLEQLAVERDSNTDSDQTTLPAAESEISSTEAVVEHVDDGDDGGRYCLPDSDTSMFENNEDVLVYKASNPALLITGGSLVDKKPKGVGTITTVQHQPTPELVLQRSVDETDDRKRSATFEFSTATSSVSVISESMVNSYGSVVRDDQTAISIENGNNLDDTSVFDTDRDLFELHNTLPTVQRTLSPPSGASGNAFKLCQKSANSDNVNFSMCKRSRFVFKPR